MSTLHPTQIGTIPSGYSATDVSQIQVGRDISAASDTFGFGSAGRPDFIERFKVYLTKNESSNKTINVNLANYGTVSIDVADLQTIVAGNSNAAAALNLKLTEVSVCDAGVAKKMIILAGPTYSP